MARYTNTVIGRDNPGRAAPAKRRATPHVAGGAGKFAKMSYKSLVKHCDKKLHDELTLEGVDVGLVFRLYDEVIFGDE